MLDYAWFHRVIQERQGAELQWILVFNFSLAKEKTSAVFISMFTVGRALLRLMLSLKGENQLNVLRRICLFYGYTPMPPWFGCNKGSECLYCCFFFHVIRFEEMVSFLSSLSLNLCAGHVLIFGLENITVGILCQFYIGCNVYWQRHR